MPKILFRYFCCFFLMLLLFSLGMFFVYCIPNKALEPQYSKSIDQLNKEETYPVYLFNSDAAIMDNFMDKEMVKTCRISDVYDNRITAVFDNNGYPRYWNGYLLTLRPMMTQFSYQQIRYLSMFLLLITYCFCFSGLHKTLNAGTALGFAVSMAACFLVFIGESLQYFSVYIILFVTLLLILYLPFFQIPENSALLIFAVGMITNFFDMLTAPLLTLGIPLIVLICLYQKRKDFITIADSFRQIFIHSLTWGMGYALCWTAKWAIASFVLGINVFEDAMKTAKFRVGGSESVPLDRFLMYRLNIETYFFAKGHKPAVFLLVLIVILIILLFRNHKKNWKAFFLPVITIGLFPYIWFFVFANHSQLHYFYTYRIQAISLFSIFSSIANAFNLKKGIFHSKDENRYDS